MILQFVNDIGVLINPSFFNRMFLTLHLNSLPDGERESLPAGRQG